MIFSCIGRGRSLSIFGKFCGCIFDVVPFSNPYQRNQRKQELKASVQELAARAASLAKVEAAKNITAPNSAYQFEASWRGLSGDCNLQAHLLKVCNGDLTRQSRIYCCFCHSYSIKAQV